MRLISPAPPPRQARRPGRRSEAPRALARLPLLLLGCSLLEMDVDRSATATIEGAGVLGVLLDSLELGDLDDLEVSIEEELADQGVEEGDLETVVLTEMSLSASPDLAFLDRVEVYVSGEGIAERLVASSTDFPEGQGTVHFDTTGADLTDIVVAGGMRFRIDAEGEAPVDDTEVGASVLVHLKATPQGACNAAADSAG